MSQIEDRREAATVLAAAARCLNDAIVLTETSVAEILSVSSEIETLAARLTTKTRPLRTLPSIDVEGFSIRNYNPVSGPASPIAPPLTYPADEPTVGRVRLGPGLEGHVGVAHGGVVALLFDEILGAAACQRAWPTVTTSLEVHFLLPVPTGEDLIAAAHVVEQTGSTMQVNGSIALQENPDRILAYGTGSFVVLSNARAQRMLASTLRFVDGKEV